MHSTGISSVCATLCNPCLAFFSNGESEIADRDEGKGEGSEVEHGVTARDGGVRGTSVPDDGVRVVNSVKRAGEAPNRLMMPQKPMRRQMPNVEKMGLDKKLKFDTRDEEDITWNSKGNSPSIARGKEAFVEVSLSDPETPPWNTKEKATSPVSGESENEQSAQVHIEMLDYYNHVLATNRVNRFGDKSKGAALDCKTSKGDALDCKTSRGVALDCKTSSKKFHGIEAEKTPINEARGTFQHLQHTTLKRATIRAKSRRLPSRNFQSNDDDVANIKPCEPIQPVTSQQLQHAILMRATIRAARRHLPSRGIQLNKGAVASNEPSKSAQATASQQLQHSILKRAKIRAKSRRLPSRDLRLISGSSITQRDVKEEKVKYNKSDVNDAVKSTSAVEDQEQRPAPQQNPKAFSTETHAAVEETCVWQELKDSKTGRYYYHNGKESIWTKPQSFDRQALIAAKEERKKGLTEWVEAKDEHGRVYWFDKNTMQSRWDRPPIVSLNAIIASSPRGSFRRLATNKKPTDGEAKPPEEFKHDLSVKIDALAPFTSAKKGSSKSKSHRVRVNTVGSKAKRAKRAKKHLEHIGGGLDGNKQQQ